MGLNKVGIVGGVLALISLLLPWWEMNLNAWEQMNGRVIHYFARLSLFLYKISSENFPAWQTVTIDILHIYFIILPTVVISGALGVAASVGGDGEKEKTLLFLAGLLTLFSIILFASSLQNTLSKSPPAPYFLLSYPGRVPPYSLAPIPKVGLFSQGVFAFENVSISYSSYLSFGFWTAAIAAVVILIALRAR